MQVIQSGDIAFLQVSINGLSFISFCVLYPHSEDSLDQYNRIVKCFFKGLLKYYSLKNLTSLPSGCFGNVTVLGFRLVQL